MDSVHTPTRRCLASGNTLPQSELVRFIVGPEGQLVPDIAGKLPGRGLWVHASRSDVEFACEKNLFSRAAKAQVAVPGDMPEMVGGLLRRNCLNLLGLARKAGDLVNGFEKVRERLKSGRAGVLVSAADGAADGRQKLRRIAPELPEISCFTSAELSAALGRENVVHVTLNDGGLARRLVQEAQRLTSYEASSPSDDGKAHR